MKRTSALALLLAASTLALAACSSGDDEPPPFPEATPSVTDELSRLTGARWAANPHPVTGKPSLFLSLDDGRPVLASATDPKEALGFLEPLRDSLGVHEPLANELSGAVVTRATAQSLGVLRFEQHVPGTRVPVFDGDVFVGVADDGSLGYIESWAASGLETFDATPSISLERAVAIAREVAPGAEIASGANEPMLGVRATDPDHPVLVFRVSLMADTSRRIDVDAKTGAIVANEATSIAGAENLISAQALFSPSDPRFSAGKALPVSVDGTNIGGTIASGKLVVREDIPACARDNVTAARSHPIPVTLVPRVPGAPAIPGTADLRMQTNCDKEAGRERTQGMAVDAAHHIEEIAKYYENQLQMRFWGTGDEITLVVHDDTITGNAVFEPSRGWIRISDAMPGSLKNGPRRYSPGTSLEFLAHEYTHGVIEAVTSGRAANPRMRPGAGLGVSGEAGALNEGIADVLAGGIEALLTGNGAGLWEFAPDVRTDKKAFRNYIDPTRGAQGGTVHFDRRVPFDSNEDAGGIHANSLLVTQAWALMVRGGYNKHSKLGVTAEIELPLSIRLFWETLASMSGPTATIRGFAEKMLHHQREGIPALNPSQTDLQKGWVKRTLVCAWTAVGVLTPDYARARYGVTCPTDGSEDKAPSCHGRANGVYCDSRPKFDYNAFECVNGSIRGGAQCAFGKYCHLTKGTFKSFARTGPDGRAICFDEPQAD